MRALHQGIGGRLHSQAGLPAFGASMLIRRKRREDIHGLGFLLTGAPCEVRWLADICSDRGGLFWERWDTAVAATATNASQLARQ